MTFSFRQLVLRLTVLSLIAALAFSVGALTPGAAFAQADITAPDGDDASDEDSSDGGDTADLTNETADDGDSDTADLTNETADDGDSDTADLTNETADDGDSDTADLTNETADDPDGADDGAVDGAVEELPSTGQGSSQQGRGLELTILASVLLLVTGAFVWTRRTQQS